MIDDRRLMISNPVRSPWRHFENPPRSLSTPHTRGVRHVVLPNHQSLPPSPIINLRSSIINPLAFLAILLSLAFSPGGRGQDLVREPTAFSAYLDFSRPTRELPIWIERVETQKFEADATQTGKTVYRIRFRRFGGLVDEVLLRVYFDDAPGARPVLSAWSEIGARVVEPQTLGQGLGLPSSQTVRIPMAGVDYVDIEAPGDGGTVRGALAVALRQTQTREALDFGGTGEVTDPFGNGEPAVTGSDDVLLFGRVKATLDPGVIALGPGDDAGEAAFDFPLEQPPLIALLTFEILNTDISAPPQLSVNGKDAGAVNVIVTDLADPALTGAIEAARPDAVYRYGGWLKCQKVVPGSLLMAGSNEILITTPGRPAPVAIRAVELQLKYTHDASSP